MQNVCREEVAMGATQASVILANERVSLLELLPDELQRYTTYTIALPTNAGKEARAFWSYLTSEAAQTVFKKFGFMAPMGQS